MSFKKEYGDHIIHFDWCEDTGNWIIWFEVDRTIYSKIETFVPHLPINRPKQIKHLFDRYDWTFECIGRKWYINIDYVLWDFVITITLENLEESLRDEIDELESKLSEYEEKYGELELVTKITKMDVPETYDIVLNISSKIDMCGKNITLSNTIFEQIQIEGRTHDNQKILELYGVELPLNQPLNQRLSAEHLLCEVRNGDEIDKDFEQMLVNICNNIEKYDKKNIDGVEIAIHTEYVSLKHKGQRTSVHVCDISVRFSLTSEPINPTMRLNFYLSKETPNLATERPSNAGGIIAAISAHKLSNKCQGARCRGVVYRSIITQNCAKSDSS